MKNLTMVLCLVFYASFSSFSQQLRYSDISTDKKLKGSFRSYISKDGTLYCVGDTLKVGSATYGTSFAYIYIDNGFVEVAAGQAPKPLYTNTGILNFRIRNIWLGGNKRNGFYALIRSKSSKALLSEIYSIELENAIEQGEIIMSEPPVEKAFTEMRKAKD